MRTIDGDALRNKLQNLADDDWNQDTATSWAEAFIECVDMIDDMPTIEPEPQWIPCSERLPDELAEVNITWINTNPAPYYEFIKGKPNTGSAVYYKGRWYWYSAVCADYLAEYGFSPDDDMDDAIKVIAWMPLPEPYRGEGD